MTDTQQIPKTVTDTKLETAIRTLGEISERKLDVNRWPDVPRLRSIIEGLPRVTPSAVDLTSPSIRIGNKDDCDDALRCRLKEDLMELHPWRKGPFDLFGMRIDTEWRSDMKWDRLKDHIAPLERRVVLDVGCSNGYHCLRMAGAGARAVIGIDALPLYVAQFHALQKYIQQRNANVFPLKIEDVPDDIYEFDTVFSMGLLYHRRAPLDHLIRLKDLLRDGGELVLETLVIDGGPGDVLSPEGRYACMPNVWFIPTVPTLESWLRRMGFRNIRCVDVTRTTSEEQRVTEWMGFQSLQDFLDPDDAQKTKEGYPAPKRAVVLSEK